MIIAVVRETPDSLRAFRFPITPPFGSLQVDAGFRAIVSGLCEHVSRGRVGPRLPIHPRSQPDAARSPAVGSAPRIFRHTSNLLAELLLAVEVHDAQGRDARVPHVVAHTDRVDGQGTALRRVRMDWGGDPVRVRRAARLVL